MIPQNRQCVRCWNTLPLEDFPLVPHAICSSGRGFVCMMCKPAKPKSSFDPKASRPKMTRTFTNRKRTNPNFYKRYILSPEWKLKSIAAIKAAGEKCFKCGSRMFLQVHHLTYKRLGREKPEDLQVLCGSCHRRVHGLIE